MWRKDGTVALVIQQTSLFLCYFEQISISKQEFIPRTWHLLQLEAHQIVHGILYNTTFLKKSIAQFLTQRALKHATIRIALDIPTIWEHCSWFDNEHPTCPQPTQKSSSIIWNYVRMPYAESNKQWYYLFGIRRELLFQYQLLALNTPFHCSVITTRNRALLHATSLFFQEESFPMTESVTALTTVCIERLATLPRIQSAITALRNETKSCDTNYEMEPHNLFTALGLIFLENADV